MQEQSNQIASAGKRHQDSRTPSPSYVWATLATMGKGMFGGTLPNGEMWCVAGMKTIGHCWVFNIKYGNAGNIKKFKAQLVVHGNRQQPGIDCMEAYSSMASLISL
ncbi:hypothetical protein O181_002576 [Austropuccinia psidii MF-1]|uniref:Uncharacterized protein n=1 Tax=Austropuccinia psidii MF-1 TaxID=1389203 RepID=A0A9Q3BD84_9BASI|nr:hypothetical protein [Austropuccinia psidii MF-1]